MDAAVAAQLVSRARRGDRDAFTALIGRYERTALAVAFAACATCLGLAIAGDWGVRGVWGALAALILVRAATMGARFARRRWLVTGWA